MTRDMGVGYENVTTAAFGSAVSAPHLGLS